VLEAVGAQPLEGLAAAIGIGAMTAAMLRLPFAAVLLATLFLGSDGFPVMPLTIVAVVVAYLNANLLASKQAFALGKSAACNDMWACGWPVDSATTSLSGETTTTTAFGSPPTGPDERGAGGALEAGRCLAGVSSRRPARTAA
jgi:hypothetical protein